MPAKAKRAEKPLTFSQLLEYHHKLVEPRFVNLEEKIDKIENGIQQFRHESNQRFDDLYKKFEALQQEYIFANAQLKRLDKEAVTRKEFQEALSELKGKVSVLQQKLTELEGRV